MPSKALTAILQSALVGPPAPIDYPVPQMIGRQEEEAKPGFFEEMSPMLVAGLADLASTELMRLTTTSPSVENNPLIRKLQVKGSNAPPMALGTLLQAALFRKLGKTGKALATGQTAASGTLAGQNMAQVGKNYKKDDRLSVWRSR